MTKSKTVENKSEVIEEAPVKRDYNEIIRKCLKAVGFDATMAQANRLRKMLKKLKVRI